MCQIPFPVGLAGLSTCLDSLYCLLHLQYCPTKNNSIFLLFGSKKVLNMDCDFSSSTLCTCSSHICFPVRKKSGRSSLALAVWNSSLSLNLHCSSSSSLHTDCLNELRSAPMTHRVAPTGRQTRGRETDQISNTKTTCIFPKPSCRRDNESCLSSKLFFVRSAVMSDVRYVTHTIYFFCLSSALVPLRKVNCLRNPGVTKESAKQRRRPLNSSPVVLTLTEWGLELTKHTITCRRRENFSIFLFRVY